MFFRYQQTANLLTVDDAYARLVNVENNGDLTFEFTYTVDHAQAINRNAHIVNVTVLSRYMPPPSLLGSTQRGAVDTGALVNNIRLQLLNAKNALLQRDKYVMGTKNSHVLANLSPDVIQRLAARAPAREIQELNVPKLTTVLAGEFKQQNDPQPLLQRVSNTAMVPNVQLTLSASAVAKPQQLMQDMITRLGQDPSYITELTPRSQSESAVRGGLTNGITAIEKTTDPASQLLNFHLFPPTGFIPPNNTNEVVDEDLVRVIQMIPDTTSDITVTVTIPAGKMKLEGSDITNAFVQFDLLDSKSNEPVDSVIKSLNISRELQIYNTPKFPPLLKAAITPFASRATLQIMQTDSSATSVRVYKKTLYAASTEDDEYSLIGNYPLTTSNNALQIQVDVPMASAAVYRAIPIGAQDAQGFEFSNIVIKPPHYTPIRALSLTAVQVDQGVRLEARSIPAKCIAIQFLKWNTTTHDSTYTTVNEDVAFIDDATRSADIVTTIDSDVFDGNVYKYVARLIMLDGDQEEFGDATVEFVKPTPGQVDTSVTDVVVQHDTAPDVSFVIRTVTTDTDMDNIKRMLTNQDMRDYFQGDIQNQRNQLANLIAHQVHRIDLTTGVRENFGTVTTPNFSDSALRKSLAIDPLQYGHSYRYEIYPLLRAPETLFESLSKTVIDNNTKKPYTFKPFKFLHPIALKQGTIVSRQGATQRFGKDMMSFGIVGSVTVIEASFDGDTAKVIKQTATRFNKYLNVITWQVQGDINQVDHFVIMKQVNGVRTTIGKAHAEFPYGSCQYLHPVTHRDNGGISYVIVPVMNDYKVGPSVVTNSVIVDVP